MSFNKSQYWNLLRSTFEDVQQPDSLGLKRCKFVASNQTNARFLKITFTWTVDTKIIGSKHRILISGFVTDADVESRHN